MTTTMRITATKRVPMDSMRKTALVAGVFYLITSSQGFKPSPVTAEMTAASTPPSWPRPPPGGEGRPNQRR